MVGGHVGASEEPLDSADLHQFYENPCAQAPAETKVIAQNIQSVEEFEVLFYAPVNINNVFSMNGILDTGLIACTFSILPAPTPLQQEIVLVG